MRDMEAFTCVMYGYPRETSINSLRATMLTSMVGDDEKLTVKSKVDLSKLPPSKANLIPHIQRVNHRVAHYKRADKAMFWSPKPYDPDQGWVQTDDCLEPLWSSGPPILPPLLINLVEQTASEMEEEDGNKILIMKIFLMTMSRFNEYLGLIFSHKPLE